MHEAHPANVSMVSYTVPLSIGGGSDAASVHWVIIGPLFDAVPTVNVHNSRQKLDADFAAKLTVIVDKRRPPVNLCLAACPRGD